jgi:mannose-6-phosphate isomerase-like protein (cupin superfamily)
MGYRLVHASDVAPAPGPHPAASAYDRGVGARLGVRAFGLYQVELPAGAASVEHDHTGDGAEDVYAVLAGRGAVLVDGVSLPVGPGDFVAVTPESRRQVRAGDGGLVYLAVCATPLSGRDSA